MMIGSSLCLGQTWMFPEKPGTQPEPLPEPDMDPDPEPDPDMDPDIDPDPDIPEPEDDA